MDKISCIDHERKVGSLYTIFAQELTSKHITEGKVEGRIEGTGRRGRLPKQLMNDMKEQRRYWKLTEEALSRTLDNSLWNLSQDRLGND
jgi:hypothetical protein